MCQLFMTLPRSSSVYFLRFLMSLPLQPLKFVPSFLNFNLLQDFSQKALSFSAQLFFFEIVLGMNIGFLQPKKKDMVFQNMLHATFYNIKDYRKKRCFNVFGHKKAISAEQDKNKKAFNLKTISKNNKMRAKE